MPMRPRIAVFIDYQNCYGAARDAFHRPGAAARYGHFVPQEMASVLAAKGRAGYDLAYVGVYCGLPDRRRDTRSAAARARQLAHWQRRGGVTAVTRTLQYPRGWPQVRAREKGIDVKLAIDAVMMAIQGQYDVAILASCDTDLQPVAEALLDLRSLNGAPEVEAIRWRGRRNRLGLRDRRLTYQVLDETDYLAMQDTTDYDSKAEHAPTAV